MSEPDYDYGDHRHYPGKAIDGRAGQIHTAVEKTGDRIDMLHQAITEFEARLAPIRAPRPESIQPDQSMPMPVLAPLADQIERHGSSIEHASRRLGLLLAELEI